MAGEPACVAIREGGGVAVVLPGRHLRRQSGYISRPKPTERRITNVASVVQRDKTARIAEAGYRPVTYSSVLPLNDWFIFILSL
jgi:hypothetical protein